eukprot:61206-Alexandrium_andersonii.AAC.1
MRIILKLPKSFITKVTKVLYDVGLERPKPVATTGASAPADLEITLPDNWDVARELHLFSNVVGKLQWLANVRPDVVFAAKTLARETSNAAPDSWLK